jgi:hypothetical protein
VAALSCDKIDDHNTWLKDVVAHCANKVRCWRASNGSPAAAVAAAAAAVAAVCDAITAGHSATVTVLACRAITASLDVPPPFIISPHP